MLCAALEKLFPEVRPFAPCRRLGLGFQSIAIETASGVVFRVGRTGGEYERYEWEARLLGALAPRLSLPVPQPRLLTGPSPELPFGAAGYPKLPGRVLDLDDARGAAGARIVPVLARFLVTLHAFATDEARRLGAPDRAVTQTKLASIRDFVAPALEARLTAPERARAERWWDEVLQDQHLQRYTPALIHHDFWFGNILIDGGRISGVLDWEWAGIGDPAVDIANLLDLGAPFVDAVIDEYRASGGAVDHRFTHRVRRHWEIRPFDGLACSIRVGDAHELRDSIRKLREGPILLDA